jgi:hypothetical protein
MIISALKIDPEESLASQVESFLNDRPELANITCIAIEVGYTDRAIIVRDLEVHYPDIAVVFTDPDWMSKNRCEPYISEKHNRLYDLVSRVVDYNTCVFARTQSTQIGECINDLQRLHFLISNKIGKITWWKVGEYMVLLATLQSQ